MHDEKADGEVPHAWWTHWSNMRNKIGEKFFGINGTIIWLWSEGSTTFSYKHVVKYIEQNYLIKRSVEQSDTAFV
jgi:uncharacterized protein with HEPN domain